MSNIDYLKIFRDALKITWKNRFLWWFGFFMILTGISNPDYFQKSDGKSLVDWQKFGQEFQPQEFIATHAKLIAILGTIAFVVFILAIFLSLIGKGAIIKSTQRLLKKESASFASGWKDGRKYFWPNFKITLFSCLALAFCLLILIIPVITLFLSKTYFIAIPLAIFATLIIIPLLVIYKYIQTYACLYATLADLRPWLAAENAYALFKKNILSSIIMSLLFIPLGILSFFAIIALLLAFLVIFGLIGLVLYLIINKIGIAITAISAILLFILTLILFYSFFLTFSEVAWVLFFHVIAKPKEKEKVEEKITEKEKATILPTTETIKTIETEE